MRRRWLDGDLSRLRFTVTLVVIALVGALIRVVYVRGILTTKSFGFDSTWYYLQSGLIFNGKGFVDPAKFLASGATSATAWHPPAYSTLLAVEYSWACTAFARCRRSAVGYASTRFRVLGEPALAIGVALVVTGAREGRRASTAQTR